MSAEPAIDDASTAAGQKTPHSVLFLFFSIFLAVVLLYFSLRKVDWHQVWQSISHCNVAWLTLGVGLGFLSYFLRGLRWRVLLNTQAHLPVLPVFWANSAGYLGNNVLPARAGELIRTAMISSRSHLSKTFVLTTALSERLMDAIVLVMSGSIVLRFVPSRPDWLATISNSLLSLGCVAAVILISIPFLEPIAMRLIEKIPSSSRAVKRMEFAVEHVSAGVRAFHDPSSFLLFLVYTISIWGLDSFGVTILARAMHMQMSMAVALLLLVGLGIGSSLPSTPGYIGIFQFVAVTVLVPFHFTRSEAIAFILVAQAGGLVVTGVLGAIGLLQYRRMRESTSSGALQT